MGLRHYSMGWIALLLLACACTSVPGRSGGEAVAMVVPDGSPQRARLNARVYDDVVARVLRDFRDPDFGGVDFAAEARARRANAIAASDELTLYDRLNRLLGLLDDSHSGATSPTDTARLQAYRENQPLASHGFQSLGMGGELLVTRVHPQGPAARAGVRPGWQWLGAADGREPGLVPAATEGATETLLFRDSAGQRRTLALTAAALPPLARHEALQMEDGVGYVWFERFDPDTLRWLGATFSAWAQEGRTDGLVLDLRDNHGGNAELGATALGWLLEGEPLFAAVRTRHSESSVELPASGLRYTGPLVVLVNAATASTAEILVARLQDSRRAVVVGSRTAGAVVASRSFPLPDGGALQIGMGEARLPGGRVLEGVGVTPDFELPGSHAHQGGRDQPLELALKVIATLRERKAGVSREPSQ